MEVPGGSVIIEAKMGNRFSAALNAPMKGPDETTDMIVRVAGPQRSTRSHAVLDAQRLADAFMDGGKQEVMKVRQELHREKFEKPP